MPEHQNDGSKRPIACIVLPTFNEAANIPIIVPWIFRQQESICSHDLLVLVVDDNSPDGTQNEVKKLMQAYPRLHLITGPKEGLGEAYKRGMAYAIEHLQAKLVFEMDADLQHSPEMIPLFVSLADYGFSLVIGSRFVAGGSTPNFSFRRRLLSLLGNWMIRFLGGLPRIHDCTSGFRCIDANLIPRCDLRFLSTRGYSFQASLLFELLRNGARVIEVPIAFPDRIHGTSKLALRDQVEFFFNIFRIRFHQSEEFIKFCFVGTSGVLVNLGLYYLLTRFLHVPIEVASLVAIEISILWNFSWNNLWTFQKRNSSNSILNRLFKYHLVSSAAGLVNYASLLVLVKIFRLWDIFAYLLGISLGTLVNYFMNSLWVWKEIGIITSKKPHENRNP